jgi:hypothetical protein
MPTPFSHLAFAERLRGDSSIAPSLRTMLEAEWSGFLLGSIAADAQVLAGMQREETHFYTYDRPMEDHPWRVLLKQHAALASAHNAAQRAFVTGYVGHLSMDEIWSLHMLHPHFAQREWAPRAQRFLMLHVLLIWMDERDLALLPRGMADEVRAAHADNWLPFLSDDTLTAWRDYIYRQIKPGGSSETLEIFGKRVNKTPEEFRAMLDSPDRMQQDLWAHIAPVLLAEIEERMYVHAREQMIRYLNESGEQM